MRLYLHREITCFTYRLHFSIHRPRRRPWGNRSIMRSGWPVLYPSLFYYSIPPNGDFNYVKTYKIRPSHNEEIDASAKVHGTESLEGPRIHCFQNGKTAGYYCPSRAIAGFAI